MTEQKHNRNQKEKSAQGTSFKWEDLWKNKLVEKENTTNIQLQVPFLTIHSRVRKDN